MGLISEVAQMSVDGSPNITVGTGAIQTIEIIDTQQIPETEIIVPATTQVVEVEVPGVQGPPGVQNVYIQENNPAVQYGWGPEETGYVWIVIQ